ncbi:MAG: ABC transporter substrate-binding protein [Actinomyces urogenitalis]|uniref:ABC transporter substrate-binding protein n=1 Tax=Actinomyces urogenitalis TaxID=103621 RepID=UPI002A80F30B|nr:ABC transporter substrate-binding protein [Actinomyces urogenitalis]MDY3679225.1 ABC transporter substrate-binding protein [Actinomyces urogenitalis]
MSLLRTPIARRSFLVSSAAALSLGALAACGGSGSSKGSGSGSSGEVLTIFNGATGTVTANFNPQSPTALQPTRGLIFETLFFYNLVTGEDPQPMLGTDFSWNEDGTQLTVTTREGVTWSDGEPFTAKDVAFTFNLIQKTPALNTSGLAATAEATDDTTVILTFPQTSFTSEADSLGNQAIFPEHLWKDVTEPDTYTNENPVGTGPFVLDTMSAQSYSLVANEKYWGGKPAVSEVRYISLENADTASASLVDGQVDWMSAFLPGIDQIIASNPDLTYVNTPSMTSCIYVSGNAELGATGPQTDKAVRQAIYHAIDRAQLNKLAGGGFAAEASPSLLVPGRDDQWIADKDNAIVPQFADLERAKQILDEAGWVEGADGVREKDGERLSLTIQTVSGWSDFISINDALVQQLAKVGIELTTSQVSWNEWNQKQLTGDYQLSLDSLGLGASTDPYFMYNRMLHSDSTAPVGESAIGGNYARYSNEVVDTAIRAAGLTNDEAEKAKQYALIQEQVAEDVPYIPIYVNSMLTEFNTSRYVGWPSEEDAYALPATWAAWSAGIILQRLKPAA